MTVAINSLENWYESVLPTLKQRQRDYFQIVWEFRERGIVNQEIAEVMTKRYGFQVFPNQISGRMSELLISDHIVISGWKKLPGSKRNHSILVPKQPKP